MYKVNTPFWIRMLNRGILYEMPAAGKTIYFTFDDGPDRQTTPEIVSILDQYDAKATFFCLGAKALAAPEMISLLAGKGHTVGNHSFSHPDGWKTRTDTYLADVRKCSEILSTRIFRPPYGRITPAQLKALRNEGMTVVMWSLLPGDFDAKITREKCLARVLKHARSGSVVVLHDSSKYISSSGYVLKHALERLSAGGFAFKALPALQPEDDIIQNKK